MMTSPSPQSVAVRRGLPVPPAALVGAHILLLLALSAFSAPQAALSPGDPAPDVELKTRNGAVVLYNATFTTPTLFLSVKPGDRYNSETLAILAETFARFPKLAEGLQSWIVVSRYKDPADLAFLDSLPIRGWDVLLDPDDSFYRSYKIIATPTITLVNPSHVVAAVHAGYDVAMAQDVRLSVAKLLGVQLPESATGVAPQRPNMTLMLARRLAQRGIWDRALTTFEQARKSGPLPPDAQLEMAECHIELKQPARAIEILEAIPRDKVDADRLDTLMKRARRLAEPGPTEPPQPPVINR